MHRTLVLLIAVSCRGRDGADSVDAAAVDAAQLDAPAVDAPSTGSATITGSLAEQTLEPTTAYYGRHPAAGQFFVAMNEGGPTCRIGFPPGLSALVGFPCGPAEVRGYVAKASDAPCELGAPHVWILVEHFTGEFSEYEATTGGAAVTAVAPAVTGTFDGEFGDKGSLHGTFSAVVCP